MDSERAFRIPVRVTYNDTKRHQFLTELANPAVSLHRLMRNPVPHGFKGLELFDAMFSPTPGAGHIRTSSMSGPVPTEPIPIDRAIWFIRVLGANEITAHRGRAQPTAAPVSAPSPVAPTPSSTNTVSANPVLPLSSNDWYTQEFTVMFTSWLRIQLGQLSLPIGRGLPKVGLPPPKPVQGVLGDEKNRFRWLAKWDYRFVSQLPLR
jgi:mediator of RNA polymerase II transcription subunit 12